MAVFSCTSSTSKVVTLATKRFFAISLQRNCCTSLAIFSQSEPCLTSCESGAKSDPISLIRLKKFQ